MAALKIDTGVHTWPHKVSDFDGDPRKYDKINAYLALKDSLGFPKFYLDAYNLEIVDYRKTIVKANLKSSNWVSYTFVAFPICKDLKDLNTPSFEDNRYCIVLCPDGRDTKDFIKWETPEDHMRFVRDGILPEVLLSGLLTLESPFTAEIFKLKELESFVSNVEISGSQNLVTKAMFFDFIHETQGIRLTHQEINHVFNIAQ